MPNRLLIGATGSVGVISLPHYLLAIKQTCPDAEVRVVLSQAAQSFVQPKTIGLFCTVITDSIEADWESDTNHIQLAQWADVMVVLPASADILARTAQGMASSLLSLTALAYEGPIVFFPNMNKAMWSNPSTRRNVGILRDYGHVVIDPVTEQSYEICTGEFETGPVMPNPRVASMTIRDYLTPAAIVNTEQPAPGSA